MNKLGDSINKRLLGAMWSRLRVGFTKLVPVRRHKLFALREGIIHVLR